MQNLVPIDHVQRYIDCCQATGAAEPCIVGVDKDEMKQREWWGGGWYGGGWCGRGRILLSSDSRSRSADGSDRFGDERYCEEEKDHDQPPCGSLHRGPQQRSSSLQSTRILFEEKNFREFATCTKQICITSADAHVLIITLL